MESAKLSTDPFPGDVVVDIMARLPVKSLKRFRSVAKSWCSLIESGEFICTHYSHATKTKVVYPLIKHENYIQGNTMVCLICKDNGVVTNFDMPSCLTSTSIEPYRMRMLGCCNGIVCLWNGAHSVVLWNLATSEFKLVSCNLSVGSRGYWRDAMGFGYDSQRDDYKVVRLYTLFGTDPRHTGVSIYNLATDSWRVFDTLFRFNIRFQHGNERNQVYTSNGFYHFLGFLDHHHKQERSQILSFDFAREVFTTTPIPGTLHDLRCQLMEFHGSLGLLCYHPTDDYTNIESVGYDVWVLLGEIGVKTTWTKVFTTQPISVDLYFLGAGIDDELFFLKNEPEGRVVLVWHRHPCSKQETLTPIVHGLGSFLDLEMYAESLVSLSK